MKSRNTRRKFGQNYLKDPAILIQMGVAIDPKKSENILEIGPGTGNLTSYILKKNPKKMFVIEKDNKLSIDLKNKFNNRLIIINDDVLKVDENNLFNDKFIVFGNLPYNISTEILSKWIINLKDNFWFECLVLMFQKEVADRIVSKVNTKNYSRITILSNWKFYIKKLFDINPECFSPRPKMKSSLLEFTPKKNIVDIKYPKNIANNINLKFEL